MTERERLEQSAAELREKAEALERQIKELDKKPGRWKPAVGKRYYFVPHSGGISSLSWKDDYVDHTIYKIGNIFKTEDEAVFHALRLESMANRWRPKQGHQFWFWSFDSNVPLTTDAFNLYFFDNYVIGNMHPTKEAAQMWYDKYGKAFEVLMEDVA